jgi:hypothetical protein
VSALGITGYQARDWLESERKLTTQLGDSRRVVCSLTYADDDEPPVAGALPRSGYMELVSEPAGRVCEPGLRLTPPSVSESASRSGASRIEIIAVLQWPASCAPHDSMCGGG